MKTEIFTIEVNNGDLAEFEGVTFGDLWNGWECPLFTLDVIKSILKDIGTEDDAKACSFSFYEFDSFYNVIIERVYWDGIIQAIDTTKPILINGLEYFSFGAYNWTWQKKSNYTF
jgi:hypothetical protein